VRRALPVEMALSAKMRLGYDDAGRAVECAQAIEAGGAGELVVHARTKADGYRPPAYWDRIGAIKNAVRLPVIANGEIWNVADAERCRAESGCDRLMLGRGIVADPGLALAISGGGAVTWPTLQPQLQHFWHLVVAHIEPRHRAGRLKQWLNYLRRRHPEADALYAELRTVNDPALVSRRLGLV
jgi:tRNA-dihydrouridine synthase C